MTTLRLYGHFPVSMPVGCLPLNNLAADLFLTLGVVAFCLACFFSLKSEL